MSLAAEVAEDPGGPADTLAQETRARLHAALRELREPATTAELARRLGLHPNGVRRHLKRLHDAGLVHKHRARQGRGRPADSWSAVVSGRDAGGGPYGDLSRWLAQAIPSRPGTREQIRRAGRRIGRELAPRRPDGAEPEDSLDELRAALTDLGFQPRIEAASGGRALCRLGRCPYAESVKENPELICTLHRGISEGLLERTNPQARVTAFLARDPDLAACAIEVEGTRGG